MLAFTLGARLIISLEKLAKLFRATPSPCPSIHNTFLLYFMNFFDEHDFHVLCLSID